MSSLNSAAYQDSRGNLAIGLELFFGVDSLVHCFKPCLEVLQKVCQLPLNKMFPSTNSSMAEDAKSMFILQIRKCSTDPFHVGAIHSDPCCPWCQAVLGHGPHGEGSEKRQACLLCSPLKANGFSWFPLLNKLLASCMVDTFTRVAIAVAGLAIGSGAGASCGAHSELGHRQGFQ